MESGIELKDVSVSLSPETRALRNVSISFRPGEFVGIVGANASGKTTLARLLNGNLLPMQGSVSVKDLITGPPQNQTLIKRWVTLISSDPENQILTATVWDELCFALRAQGTDQSEMNRRCEAALETFDLVKNRDVHPFFLSVGEQFRLLLATGYVREPRFFILDEVLSMLDIPTRHAMLQLFLRLRTESRVGVVLLTHRLDDLIHTNRIVVLHKGEIQMDDTVTNVFREVLKHPEWKIEAPLLYRVCDQLTFKEQTRFTELVGRVPIVW